MLHISIQWDDVARTDSYRRYQINTGLVLSQEKPTSSRSNVPQHGLYYPYLQVAKEGLTTSKLRNARVALRDDNGTC